MIGLNFQHSRDHAGVYVFFRKDRKNKNIARVSQVIELDYDGYTKRNLTKEYHDRPVRTNKEYQDLRLSIAEKCHCLADNITFMIHDPSICFDEIGRMFPVDFYDRS